MTNSQRILSVAEAAKHMGLSESTLNKGRMTGRGPLFIKISARRVGYDLADLDEYLATNRRRSTSDQGAR
jgi:predicted DNA-binding transcriptional regulator AlpA